MAGPEAQQGHRADPPSGRYAATLLAGPYLIGSLLANQRRRGI